MLLDWVRRRGPRAPLVAGLAAVSLVGLLGAASPPRDEAPMPPAPVAGPPSPNTPATSVQPAPAPEKPAAPVAANPLVITVLRAGREPYAWGEADTRTGRRPLLTFVTDDLHTCRVTAWAQVPGRPGVEREIRWQVEPPAGFVLEGEPKPGAELRATLTRTAPPPATVGPLTLTVRATLERDGQRVEAVQTVTQDARDQLRQEYVDLERELVPERYRFMDAEAFAARFGKRFPSISFTEVNYSLNPATGERYPCVIVTEALMLGLKRAERLLGSEFVFTSCYRNPRRQEEVHGSVNESQHQYGYAADLLVTPGAGRDVPNEGDWLRMAEAACTVGASFVEPILACHPNTTGCHLHMDFRESGVTTFPVRIKGILRDAATGQPIPDATVTYGGIPAQSGPNGYFALRNVLSARERPLEVQAPGYLPLTQMLSAAAGTNEVKLTLQAGPRPALAITTGKAAWKNEAAGVGTLELRLQNTGAAEAVDVRLRAPGFQIAPERIPSLPVGPSRSVTLFFRRERSAAAGPLQVELEASYAARDGLALTTALTAEAAVPAWTLPAPSPAPGVPDPAAQASASQTSSVPAAPKRGAVNTAAAAAGSTAAAIAGAVVSLQRRRQRKGDDEAQAATSPLTLPGTPEAGVAESSPSGPKSPPAPRP